MKYLMIGLPVFSFLFFLNFSNPHASPEVRINSLLGDVSGIEKYGEGYVDKSERERITAHLNYVLERLRAEKINAHVRERNSMLDYLAEYISRGEFPKNYDWTGERRPCFLDRDGNICAVGYLVEQSAGRGVVEKINNEFQYARIEEIDDASFREWVKKSGLTLEELAMIQPNYEFMNVKLSKRELRRIKRYSKRMARKRKRENAKLNKSK